MKRLLCLLLALIMLLSLVLTSCGEVESTTTDPTDEEGLEADVDTNTGAKTITLRIISEKEVCNNADELAAYLKDECGGDTNSQKYKDMLETMKAYQAVEDEISKKTKSDYKTKVDILFYTEDEYVELLEQSMADYALEQKNAERAERALEYYTKEYRAWMEAQGYSADEFPDSAIANAFYKEYPEYEAYRNASDKSTASEDTYVTNELGIKELVYPEAEKNQIDIIYVSGYDMYTRYVENEWIAPLNSYITTTGLPLTYNISPTLLDGVKIGGEIYAVPNNVQIGEYTYMLIDKELADEYSHTYKSFGTIADCGEFANDIAVNEPNILPIDSTFEECMSLFVWYWNIDSTMNEETARNDYTIGDSTKFSILGKFYSDPSKVGRGSIDLGFESLLANAEYRETLRILRGYEIDGFYNKGAGETRKESAAISFVTGGYEMYRNAFYKQDENGVYTGEKKSEANVKDNYGVYTDENGKEYYLYIAKYPQAGNEELYGNMFAISASSKNTQACMEVITLLNTDSTVRNLLQYGIKQGEHSEGQVPNYTIDEETGVLKRLNNLYMMKIERTGNCFIAHPEEGLAPDYWENAKMQNNDALIDPLMGFDFNERLAEYGSSLDDHQLELCAQVSAEQWELIIGTEDKAILKRILASGGEIATAFSKNQYAVGEDNIKLDKMTNNNYDPSTGGVDGTADEGGESPYTIYYKWLTAFNYLPPVE